MAFFESLDHFMMFVFGSVTFESNLDGFCDFGRIQKSEIADQDGCHSEMITKLLRHVTSSAHGPDFKEDISRPIYSLRHAVIAFIFSELRRVRGKSFPPPLYSSLKPKKARSE